MDESRRRPQTDLKGRTEDPSTLYALWPEREYPLEEEVRLALQAAYPGIQQVDDLAASEDLLWGVVFRLENRDYLVWAEARGDLTDAFLQEGLGGGEEFQVARKGRWLLGVETVLDSRSPQASFQEQLRFLCHAVVPGVVAVYDENALAMRGGKHVMDLADCTVPPRASTLYAINSISGKGGTWLHTHGLGRTGLPELDLLGLPAAPDGDEDPVIQEGFDLIDALVDTLLSGGEVDRDGHVEVGDGLALRVLPLDKAMPLFPPDQAGGSQDRTGDMEDHAGNRLVLLEAERDRPPLALLSKVGRAGTLYKSEDETRRQRTLSLSRWGTFGQLFVLNRDPDWQFRVLLAYTQRVSPRNREHLWFEVLELKPGRIRGRLMNHPVDVPELSVDRDTWEPLDRLTDWLIVTPEGRYDPELAPALLAEWPS